MTVSGSLWQSLTDWHILLVTALMLLMVYCQWQCTVIDSLWQYRLAYITGDSLGSVQLVTVYCHLQSVMVQTGIYYWWQPWHYWQCTVIDSLWQCSISDRLWRSVMVQTGIYFWWQSWQYGRCTVSDSLLSLTVCDGTDWHILLVTALTVLTVCCQWQSMTVSDSALWSTGVI